MRVEVLACCAVCSLLFSWYHLPHSVVEYTWGSIDYLALCCADKVAEQQVPCWSVQFDYMVCALLGRSQPGLCLCDAC